MNAIKCPAGLHDSTSHPLTTLLPSRLPPSLLIFRAVSASIPRDKSIPPISISPLLLFFFRLLLLLDPATPTPTTSPGRRPPHLRISLLPPTSRLHCRTLRAIPGPHSTHPTASRGRPRIIPRARSARRSPGTTTSLTSSTSPRPSSALMSPLSAVAIVAGRIVVVSIGVYAVAVCVCAFGRRGCICLSRRINWLDRTAFDPVS